MIINDLTKIYNAGIEAVIPSEIYKNKIFLNGNKLKVFNKIFDLNLYKNIYVIGFGKASSEMCFELEKLLKSRINDGLILTKYGHTNKNSKIETLESAHPVPDEQGIKNTRKLLDFLKQTKEDDLVITLVSGGGSALLISPEKNIFLEEYQNLIKLLLSCGADITEINTIRKFFSLVKGGQLLNYIFPATNISLIISDVIGDDIKIISSAPTVPHQIENEKVYGILKKYELVEKLSEKFINLIQTKKYKIHESNDNLKNFNFILSDNITCLKSAKSEADKLGYNTLILSSSIAGDTEQAADFHVSIVNEVIKTSNPIKLPACIISGGETTVKIKGNGKGGRNQEFVIQCLDKLDFNDKINVCVGSIGTDGTDGPTDAAGAYIDNTSFFKINELNLNLKKYIENNDSYNFFDKLGTLIKTGPTGTNVMDLRIFLIK